jgi:rare lipoprotein A
MIIVPTKVLRQIALMLIVMIFIGASPALSAKETRHHHSSANKSNIGMASFYATKFNGRRTASGEIFDNSAMTAAHRSLPFGTQVKVTNVRNGRSVVVRINDRGPYAKGRIIDLTKSAAKKIGVSHKGVARVKLEVLSKNKRNSTLSNAEMNSFLDDVTEQQN